MEEAQLLLFTHPCIVPTDILTHSFFANLHLQLKEQDKQVGKHKKLDSVHIFWE